MTTFAGNPLFGELEAWAALAKEKAGAFLFTAELSGAIEEILLGVAKTPGTCTDIDIAIFTDNAGEPGTIIAGTHKKLGKAPTKEAMNAFTGLSGELVAGTKYWICFLSVGGTLKVTQRAGLTKDRVSTVVKAELTSSMAWNAAAEQNTVVFAVNGTLTSGGAMKGTLAGTATAAGRAQAPGVAKGASAATGAAAGRSQAPGSPKGASAATAGAVGRGQAAGVAKGAASSTSGAAARGQAPGFGKGSSAATGAAAGRAQAPGGLRGVSGATSVWSARVVAAGALRGAATATGAAAGRLQGGGRLRGVVSATADAFARMASVTEMRGSSKATAGTRADLQAKGNPRGASTGAAATAFGRLQGMATLAGRSSATIATRGLAGALGGLRGRWEAVSVWLGRMVGPLGVRSCDVEWEVVSTVHANVQVHELVAFDVEVEATAAANLAIVGGGV